ncbi:MAG: SRPBCC family protein [Armatimonadetes bacterium]|nr:SRPBCC family protein [Armatimonadota bacterium]
MSINYTPNTNSSAQTADLPPTATITGKGGHPNVSDTERVISGVAGAVIAGYALTQTKNTLGTALPLGLLGGYLLYRGATGNCPTYTALRTGTGQQTDSKIAVIPEGQGIKIVKAMTIQKPASELYTFWRNFENLPVFMKHLEAVTVTDETHSSWTAKAPFGQTVSWDAEILSDEPNKRIVWRSLEHADIPNTGTVRFEELSAGRGTAVTVSLEYNPPLGMVGAVVAKMFGEEPGTQVHDSLRRFKELMETGELPTIQGQPNGVLGRNKTEGMA